MDNLLSNAIKFTPAGGQVRVRLHAAGHDRRRSTSIDSGSGIRATTPTGSSSGSSAPRTAVAQQTPGAGLGLTIALAIVEAHGGHHRGGQQRRGGTTFRMTLPLARLRAPERVADGPRLRHNPPDVG